MSASVSELSLKGCYLDTLNADQVVNFSRCCYFHRARKDDLIYPQANMGIGVEFSAVEPEQLEVLLKWLEELSAK